MLSASAGDSKVHAAPVYASIRRDIRRPVRFGVVGLGGYAGHICDTLAELHLKESQSFQFVAVTDPAHASQGMRLKRLGDQGVKLQDSFDDLLKQDIDIVWLPLPIHLHREFTERCLAAGKAVLCEKPAAGSVQDVDAMIAARDKYQKLVAIGFQHIYEPNIACAKQSILLNGLGKPLAATLIGCWPRPQSYFDRNHWAGKLKQGDHWVVDSPASNALAHYINLCLFLMGDTLTANIQSVSVAAEMYRVNSIETFDTCSMKICTAIGADLKVFLTHACKNTIEPQIHIDFEHGKLVYHNSSHAEVWRENRLIDSWKIGHASAANVARGVARRIANPDDTSDPIATLEMSRQHVAICNAGYEAGKILNVPDDYIDIATAADHTPLRSIRGIEQAFLRCARDRAMLHDASEFPWTRSASAKSLIGYTHFEPVK